MTKKAVRLISWFFCVTSLWLSLAADANTNTLSTTYYSAQFLGRPYLAGTLGGGPDRAEQFTLRLDGFDCFTFIDTLEAMRRPGGSLADNLRQVRYRGPVSWQNRNHFFTDWLISSPEHVRDVTATLGLGLGPEQEPGAGSVPVIRKTLNQKADGTLWLEGIPVRETRLSVVSPQQLNYAALQSGDYLGIYSPLPGLDVSHVGLVIRKQPGAHTGNQPEWYLRHASSRYGKVVDEKLSDYLTGKPGVIVLRPYSHTQPQTPHSTP